MSDTTDRTQLLTAASSPLVEGPLRASMTAALQTAVPGHATDDLSDPGVALVSALAVALDQVGFYHDRIEAEAHIDTARLVESIRKLGEIPGVQPLPALGASVVQHFDASAVLTLPPGTLVTGTSAAGPTVFETRQPLRVDPALSGVALSPVLTLHSGAFVAVVEVASSDFISSTAAHDDLWAGASALVSDQAFVAEIVQIRAARHSAVGFMLPLEHSFPAECQIWRLTEIRRMQRWWPGYTHAPPAFPPDARGQQLWIEASDAPIAWVRGEAGKPWRSTLEVFVVQDAGSGVPLPDQARWTEVADFSASKPSDLHFTTFLDDRLHTWVAMRAVRAVRPQTPDQIRTRFVRSPGSTLPQPNGDALGLYTRAFTSPLVQAGGGQSQWAILEEHPGLSAGDQVVLAYADGRRAVRQLGRGTQGRLLDWSPPPPPAGKGDADGHEPGELHAAVAAVPKAADLSVFRLDDVVTGPSLTRLDAQAWLRRNQRQDQPDVKRGDRLIGVSDPSLFKPDKPVLIGTWGDGEWISGEVTRVSAVLGSALVLDPPLRADHAAPVRLLAPVTLATSGQAFAYAERARLVSSTPVPKRRRASRPAGGAVAGGGSDKKKTALSPPKASEKGGIGAWIASVGVWVLKQSAALERPAGKQATADAGAPAPQGEEPGVGEDLITPGSAAVTLRVPGADFIPLKEWERDAPKAAARDRFVQAVTGHLQVGVAEPGEEPSTVTFIDADAKGEGGTYDIVRTPDQQTSITVRPQSCTKPEVEITIGLQIAPPPPPRGADPASPSEPPAAVIDLDVKRTLFLAEAKSLKPGADLFLQHKDGWAHAVVVAVDGEMVSVDDGFDELTQQDVLTGRLTTWSPEAVAFALHPSWYELPLALGASGQDTIPVGDTLLLTPGAEGLDAVAPGDAITLWDEPHRLAWAHARTGTAATAADDDAPWWRWPDMQAVGVVKSVEADIGLVTLETPAPPVLAEGAQGRLRVMLSWPSTFRGERAITHTTSVSQRASGPVFEASLDAYGHAEHGTAEQAVSGEIGGVRVSNFEVFVRDPKTQAWTVCTQVRSLDGLKAPGVVVEVQHEPLPTPTEKGAPTGTFRITLAFGDKDGPGLPASGLAPVRVRLTRVCANPDAQLMALTPQPSRGPIDSTAYDELSPRSWTRSPWQSVLSSDDAPARIALPRSPGTLGAGTEPVSVQPVARIRWAPASRVYRELVTTDVTASAGATSVIVGDTGPLLVGQRVAFDRGDALELRTLSAVDASAGVVSFDEPLASAYPAPAVLLGNLAEVFLGRTTSIPLGIGDGSGGQRFVVRAADKVLFDPVDGGQVQSGIVRGGERVWTWVSSLADQSGDAFVYTLHFEGDEIFVVFGDGTHGAVPPPGQRLIAELPVGDPALGTVQSGALDALKPKVAGIVSTRNLTSAVGFPEEHPAGARETVLTSVLTPGDHRLLTTDDLIPMARALFPDELADLELFTSSAGAWLLVFSTMNPSEERDEQIADALERRLGSSLPTLSHVRLLVRPAELTRMELSVEVDVEQGEESATLDRIRADLSDTETGFFSPTRRKIGQPIRAAQLARWLEQLGARAVRFTDSRLRSPTSAVAAPLPTQVVAAGAVYNERSQRADAGISTLSLRFTDKPTARAGRGSPDAGGVQANGAVGGAEEAMAEAIVDGPPKTGPADGGAA